MIAASILEPLSQEITRRALIELTILGAACGPLGVWIVLYRQSYAAESVAHAMLPGLVLAALIGAPLGIGAAAGLMLGAGLIALASRQAAVGSDVAVAVTVTALFGLGSLLALSPEVPLRIGELLFGDPLSVSDTELLASGALALLALAALAAGNRTLSLAAFEPVAAASLGGRPGRAQALLLALLALTTLIAVQALGNLLVVAIIVAPAAAALRLQSRLVPALITAAALAVLAGVAGLYLSYYAEVATGAAVALFAVAEFVMTIPLAGGGMRRRLSAGPRTEAGIRQ
jgi:ABC-type Mn2+/Zn2+ transport system permease subunit